MISLKAKNRKELGKKVKDLRKEGKIPAVLYGPKIENISIEIDSKEFGKVFQEAGESSLIELQLDQKKYLVLIYDVESDPVSMEPIHIDFYQPKLDEEIEAGITIIFEGEAPAVRDLGGTLVKNMHELEVRALPQNLPHEIRVSLENLKTFEDNILVKDLVLPANVKVLKELDETVAFVAEPEKVEEELEKPIEEKVEEVKKVEKPEKTEEEGEKE